MPNRDCVGHHRQSRALSIDGHLLGAQSVWGSACVIKQLVCNELSSHLSFAESLSPNRPYDPRPQMNDNPSEVKHIVCVPPAHAWTIQ